MNGNGDVVPWYWLQLGDNQSTVMTSCPLCVANEKHGHVFINAFQLLQFCMINVHFSFENCL